MINLIKTELMKLMKSRILWIMAIGAFVPVFLAFIQFMPDRWQSVFNLSHTYLNACAIPIFIFIAGYIFTVEYRENTIHLLFTSPVSRMKILAAKLLIMLPVILATYLLSLGITILAGMIFTGGELPIILLREAIFAYLKTGLIQFALIPPAVTAAIIGRNYVLMAVKGIVLFLAITTTTYTLESFVLPWSLPYILAIRHGIYENEFFPIRNWNLQEAAAILIALFMLSTAFNVIYYRRSEI